MDNLYYELSKTSIFNGLDPAVTYNLLNGKPFQIKKFVKDEIVAFSNDECNNLLILVEGAVRGEMTDFTGKKIKIEDITAPGLLAVAFIFGKNNRFPVDIIASEPSRVIIIPRDVLIFLLQQNKIILKNYLDAVSSRTQFLSDKIRFLSFKTIKEKIAHYILNQSTNDRTSIILPQSQTKLADYFGVTRPSLARALGEMEAENIIKVSRREITIVDIEKMNKLLTQ